MIFNVMKYGTSEKIQLPIPSQSNTLTYNGNAQSPIWNNLNTSLIEVSGDTSKTNAGEYTTKFHIIDPKNYSWEGGSSTDKSVTWTIGRATVSTVPSQSGTLTYTGNYLSPSWSNFNSSQITLGGETSKINAGTYQAEFTPTDNYQWSDGSTTYKTVNWTIAKAAGQITLNPSTLNLTSDNPTGTVTITKVGDGTISNTGSGSSTGLSWTVTQTKVTVTATDSASKSLAISVSKGTNHLSASATLTINSTFKVSIENMTWAQISEYSQSGTISNYAAVGDTKKIVLNGKIGYYGYTVSNLSVDLYIIGIDHNRNVESPSQHRTHFKLGKINGTQIAFIDSKYDSTVSSIGYLSMNGSATNSGGWQSSQLRIEVMGGNGVPSYPANNSLIAALPSDLRNVMKSVTKYTDNTANGTSTESNVTGTSEYLCPLAEFELYGNRKYANQYEQNKQEQYEYYKNGNSVYHYKYNSTGTLCANWLRSPCYSDNINFCKNYSYNISNIDQADVSLGITGILFI